MTQVLEWLLANHPELHAAAEQEREWLWLIGDLRGDHNKAVRDSIKAYGFKFVPGSHILPSGNVSHWGHSCSHPTRFGKRKGKGGQPSTTTKELDADTLSVLADIV